MANIVETHTSQSRRSVTTRPLLSIIVLAILWNLPSFAQSKVPTLDVGFANQYGCNTLSPTPAVFSVENGAYFIGQTSCDFASAAAYGPTGFGYAFGDVNLIAVSSGSIYELDSQAYCLVRPGTTTCDSWVAPILPLSVSGTWVVGGYNSIYHAGSLFDPTQGVRTNWVSVITNPRGDAFVLGYAATGFPTKNAFQPTGSGPLLVEFSGVDQSMIFATYLSSLRLDTVVGIARDNGGNIYLSGSGPSGPALAKLSPNLPQKILYRKGLPYGGGPIAVDGYSQVYMRGSGTGVPMVNATQPISSGVGDSSVIVLSPKADRIVYSSYLGGTTATPVGVSLTPNSTTGGYNALLGGLEIDDNWNKVRANACLYDPNSCGPWFYTATFGPLLRSTLPASLNFHGQHVGTTTLLKLPFKNIGNAPLFIAGDTISGSSAFAVKNNCTGVAVKPDLTCMFSVVFTPTSTGAQTGFLVVSSNSLDGPQTVQLNGIGQ